MAYKNALDFMNDITWTACCEKVSETMCDMGYEVCDKSIRLWNMEFRVNNLFNHPNPIISSGKTLTPPLFDLFPEVKDSILTYCLQNISDLNVTRVHNYIVDNLLPNLQKTTMHETVCNEAQHFLESLTTNPPNPTTIWRWMKFLNFNYDTVKKHILWMVMRKLNRGNIE